MLVRPTLQALLLLIRASADASLFEILEDALYNKDSEATCRIAIDIMLVQRRKYLRRKYQSAETTYSIDVNDANATNPSTPRKAVVDMPAAEPMKRVKLFPESSMSIEMHNKLIPNSKFLVTGRADWALGYSTAGDNGTFISNVCPDSRITITKQALLKAIWMCIRVSTKAVCLFNHTTS